MRKLCVGLAVAGVVVLTGAAPAMNRSPYLAPLQCKLEQIREERGDQMTKRRRRALDRAIEKLDADGVDFNARLRAFKPIARLASKLGDDTPGGLLDDAATGFAMELQDAERQVRAELNSLVPKSPKKLLRIAERTLDAMRRTLDQIKAGNPAPANASKVKKAYERLLKALRFLGKLDNNVVITWVECDSAGMVGTPYVRGTNCRVVEVDGHPRRFVVYVPQTLLFQPNQDTPIVVMHHGSTGTGEQFLNHSGWVEKAEEVGCVVAFPTGLQYLVLSSGRISTKWNAYPLINDIDPLVMPPGYPAGSPWPADDIKFENAILDDLEAHFMVDPGKIFVTGFSNGASFAARCSVEMSDRYVAAGYAAGGIDMARTPVELIPVSVIGGTADDGVVERANNPSTGPAPNPPLTELPLDPNDLLAMPDIVDHAFGSHLDTWELEFDPHVITERATSTTFQWETPKAGNTSGNVFQYSFLAGLEHHYPHGAGRADLNPNQFVAADIFWQFWMTHVGP